MNRIHSHRPVKQRRALLESNPPRDRWIDRRRNRTVSTFWEAKNSPEPKRDRSISEPEHASKNSSKTVSKSSHAFRDAQQQQRKITLSSSPFFRSKRTP